MSDETSESRRSLRLRLRGELEAPPALRRFGSWLVLGVSVVALSFLINWWPGGSGADEVVIYAAQDQVYAEPILKEFERTTGHRVRAIYDSEAVKTVGLATRLLAEQQNPRCDVFWGNEELRTRQLASRKVFRETNGWMAFGYRSRRLAMSRGSRQVPAPNSWRDLTNAEYRGRIAMAYPLFGSTATHLLALRQHWGEAAWLDWCRALAENRPFIVDGNSVTVRFLERGEAALALTDSDDIKASVREGADVEALPLMRETLLIPNTVAIVRQCRHPQAAEELYRYLQSRVVLDQLVAAGALEGGWAPDVWAATLQPDWEAVLREMDTGIDQMKQIFRR